MEERSTCVPCESGAVLSPIMLMQIRRAGISFYFDYFYGKEVPWQSAGGLEEEEVAESKSQRKSGPESTAEADDVAFLLRYEGPSSSCRGLFLFLRRHASQPRTASGSTLLTRV